MLDVNRAQLIQPQKKTEACVSSLWLIVSQPCPKGLLFEKSAQRAQSRSRQGCSGDAMKSSIGHVFSLLVLTCMAVPAGCGGGGVGGGQPTATHFSVSAQGNVIAGTTFNFTVTALDAANNVVSTYTGPVHFTSTDGRAILPADSRLINGVGNFLGHVQVFRWPNDYGHRHVQRLHHRNIEFNLGQRPCR